MRRRRMLWAVISIVVAGAAPWSVANPLDATARAARSQVVLTGSFACYPGQFTGFRQAVELQVSDRIAGRRRTVRLGAPETVCAPVASVGSRYLACHLTDPFLLPAQRAFQTATPRTTVTLKALSPADVVCVESARVEAVASPGATRLRGVMVCYRNASVSFPFRGRPVFVRDPFESSSDTLGTPYRVCASTSAAFSPRYLACYKLSSEAKAATILLQNRYGFLKAALGGRFGLCLPAMPA